MHTIAQILQQPLSSMAASTWVVVVVVTPSECSDHPRETREIRTSRSTWKPVDEVPLPGNRNDHHGNWKTSKRIIEIQVLGLTVTNYDIVRVITYATDMYNVLVNVGAFGWITKVLLYSKHNAVHSIPHVFHMY